MKKFHKYLLLLLMSTQTLSAEAKGLSASAEALIWKVSQQPSTIWGGVTTFYHNGKLKSLTGSNISFDWNTGFRAGLFYEPENGFWDTSLNWTYYPTTKTVVIPVGGHIVSSDFFSGFLSEDIFFGAELNWQLALNMFNLTASHQFDLTQSLSIRPSVGVTGGTINQTANVNWNALVYISTERVTNNFLGAGPSFGVDAQWNFYDNFSLVGDLSGAFMYGRWNANDIYRRPRALLGLIPARTITTTMNQSEFGTLMLDYFMGVEWLYKGRSQVNFILGYEMQYWANQMRMASFQILPLRGDLTLQGVTCGISIDF
jgi:hypothetical protein